MLLNFIFLSCFTDNLLTALALCILPFLLGWLAAYAFYGIAGLKAKVAELSSENESLTLKLNNLHNENTEIRVKMTQLEAEIEAKAEQIRKMKNELIICEAERSNLQIAIAGGAGGKEAAKKATPPSINFAGAKYKWDDLKIVEGIGPKIAELCNAAGIHTWDQLANTAVDRLREILDAAGPNFQIHDPGTWPEQAALAAKQDWDALKKLQDELKGGK